MDDPLNFDIEGLAIRYELHPERQDIFVEGERDQSLLRAFLDHCLYKNVSVLPVSVVNIPPELLLEKNLPHPSRRSDVIALALELEARNVLEHQVSCIADVDFDFVFLKRPKSSLLLYTDYASMELNAFSSDVLHGVLVTVSPATGCSGDQLLSDLVAPLQFLFSTKATNVELGFGLAWLDKIERSCSFGDGHIRFDEEDFMQRYLVERVSSVRVQEFRSKLGEIQAALCFDDRCKMNGHDFVRILGWYLRSVEKRRHLNDDAVRQMLFLRIRPEELAKEPMFLSLLKRIDKRPK